jgi:hypothetical protein
MSDRERLLELDSRRGEPLRLSPTDISQYIRLDQCRRFLRLRLLQRNADLAFLHAWEAQAQSPPTLLTQSGKRFEHLAENAIGAIASTVSCREEDRRRRGVSTDHDLLIATARELKPGARVVLFQPTLEVEINGWALKGIADAVDLQGLPGRRVSAFIVDFKSSTAARMEHRLQVAFYREMLATLFAGAGIDTECSLGILYRGAAHQSDGEEHPILALQRQDALATFGVEGFLERIEDPGALQRHVWSLVLGDPSEARRNLATPFDQLPFHLNYVCDGCLYNQFCLRQCAETDNLSLVPLLETEEKLALVDAGLRRSAELAAIPIPAEAQSEAYRQLAEIPALGVHLEDIVYRARSYRRSKGDDYPRQEWLPDGRQSSLPLCTAEVHPNLVRVFIDVEHDYLHDRVYLLGALVSGAEAGEERPERRRAILHIAAGSPADDAIEAELLRGWIRETIAAIAEVAAPDEEGQPRAPIHLIFYDSYDQRVLLAALGRHLNGVFGATPLYDFVSQLAAYTSPVLTVLRDDIRAQKAYPLLCQSLQSVARYLRFPWDAERPLTQIFRERYFDVAGRFDEGAIPEGDASPWYTKRSRFSSQLPLEYAYTAWDDLPEPEPSDPLQPFRDVTLDDLRALHETRLEAIAHIAGALQANRWAMKQSFDLSKLSTFEDVATSYAEALDEFITIERHVELAGWKLARSVAPERRVLAGDTLLVRYHEEDQEPEWAAYNRALFDYCAEPQPEGAKPPARPTGPLRYRLRVDVGDAACSIEHALSLWTPEPGGRVVISSRWKTDSRKPQEERVPFSPTVRQLLTGAGAIIEEVVVDRAVGGEVEAFIDVEVTAFGGKQTEFVFNQPFRGFEPGALHTIDPSPTDRYGSFQRTVVQGLKEGQRNALFDRLTGEEPASLDPDGRFVAGQRRFLEGLDALAAAGRMHGFEEGKRRLIGRLAEAPSLLVQGPPGTGKSLTAAYAILARLQGAMAAEQEYRVIVACKTHAAVDELLSKLIEVRERLASLRAADPALWDRHFDLRLLDVPCFRFEGKSDPPAGAIPLARRERSGSRPEEPIGEAPHCIVAAGLAGVYRMAKERVGGSKKRTIFDQRWANLLVLDEASQINLPEAIMGALALRDSGQLIVIGDHRQMPPIVRNDWEREVRRTFALFRSYESLFLTLRGLLPEEHQIRFEESFRVHADIAEFLRQGIYRKDGIAYFSRKREVLPVIPANDDFVAAVLEPRHPLTVVVHDETSSQQRNAFEEELMRPVLEALAAADFDARTGLGVVVPHTAQRAALREGVPALVERDPETGVIMRSAVDTVERFQGSERIAIVVGATESDPLYLLLSGKFLLDPRRLNVAISRAKQKLILVGSRTIFDLFATDEEVFAAAQLWKDLLERTCTMQLWQGERHGHHVTVRGNPSTVARGN